MAKDPAFLFYYQDFLVGTSFMTFEEIGAYIKLLCFQADMGRLTEAQILKKIPASIWSAICCKFKKDEKGFFNERLEIEVLKRQNFTKSRRDNLHMDKHMDKHMDTHMENENENINKNKDIDIYNNAIHPYYKDESFHKTFMDYLEMRKKIRKPATDRAIELVLRKLIKHPLPIAIKMLEQSIENSWQGIFELRPLKTSSKPRVTPPIEKTPPQEIFKGTGNKTYDDIVKQVANKKGAI